MRLHRSGRVPVETFTSTKVHDNSGPLSTCVPESPASDTQNISFTQSHMPTRARATLPERRTNAIVHSVFSRLGYFWRVFSRSSVDGIRGLRNFPRPESPRNLSDTHHYTSFHVPPSPSSLTLWTRGRKKNLHAIITHKTP